MKRIAILLISCFFIVQCTNNKRQNAEEELKDSLAYARMEDSIKNANSKNKIDSTTQPTNVTQGQDNKQMNEEIEKLKACFNSAIEKFNQQKYDEAIALFSKVLEADKNNYQSYFNRGLSKYRLKDYNNAIKDFSKAIKIEPKFADAYKNRGDAKTYTKDLAGALNDYSKAIELNPNNKDAYKNRGFVKLMLKDTPGGCVDLHKAAEMGDTEVLQIIQQNCQ